jgi:Uma2 family endonuclease
LIIAVPNYISPEEYLEIEGQNPIRHEYRRGLVYAMSRGSDKKIETLQEYILISQDKPQVECRRRTDTNTWETIIYQSDDPVFLSSINLEFGITQLYRGLD